MFRFSIRDMLLVTLAAGLSTGWWVSYSRMRQRVEAVERQKEAFQWESEKLQLLLKSDGYQLDLTDSGLRVTVAYKDGFRSRSIDR
ncbi:MAG: hypothetical protein IAF94_20475 [Pirellulaceae bacterium]|nr:hypothetical protein [Pirellulaceae bacterium]